MIGCGERHTSPSLVSFPTIAAYFAGLRLDFRKNRGYHVPGLSD
jgi:hypothetical protein